MNPRILYLIKRMETESTGRMTSALEPFKLTPIQFAIIYFVDHDKGDLSSSQLSRRFSMTPQSMNEHIGVLGRKKLLKKTTDPSHRKILRITLTDKGKKILAVCNSQLDAVESKFLKQLSKKEIENMKVLIGKILESNRENGER